MATVTSVGKLDAGPAETGPVMDWVQETQATWEETRQNSLLLSIFWLFVVGITLGTTDGMLHRDWGVAGGLALFSLGLLIWLIHWLDHS
jgi:hypothetical protein